MDNKRSRKPISIRKITTMLLCLMLVISCGEFPLFVSQAYAAEHYDGPTQNIVTPEGRIADPDTHDSYIGQLLGGDIYGSLIPAEGTDLTSSEIQLSTNGSRYAGRLWAQRYPRWR